MEDVASSSGDSGSTQIHSCRWDWCTQHYGSIRDLEDHVIGYHVAHELPVEVSQVRLRADGKWVSLEPSSLFRPPTESGNGSVENTTSGSGMTHSSHSQHSQQPTSSNPQDPSFPLAEFLDFPPSPHSTVSVPPGQPSPEVSMSSSGSAPLPTQPPAPFLPFGSAQGDDKKRIAGVRHSWGLGGQ